MSDMSNCGSDIGPLFVLTAFGPATATDGGVIAHVCRSELYFVLDLFFSTFDTRCSGSCSCSCYTDSSKKPSSRLSRCRWQPAS